MEKHEMIYRTYQRNHKFGNCQEVEERKIDQEKKTVLQNHKQVDKKMKKLSFEDVKDEDLDDLEYLMYAEDKTRKNNHTHKERLKELKKNKEFR